MKKGKRKVRFCAAIGSIYVKASVFIGKKASSISAVLRPVRSNTSKSVT